MRDREKIREKWGAFGESLLVDTKADVLRDKHDGAVLEPEI